MYISNGVAYIKKSYKICCEIRYILLSKNLVSDGKKIRLRKRKENIKILNTIAYELINKDTFPKLKVEDITYSIK